MTTATKIQQPAAPVRSRQVQVVRPLVDIYENNHEFLLHIEMAGVERDNISIDLENNVLSLSGVRHHKVQGDARVKEFSTVEYRNSFSLPESIATTKVKAKLEAGVLHLTLPKLEAVKPRIIPVQ